MKKFITLAMTFIMIIVMATSSFAATVETIGGNETGNVNVTINKNDVQTVYSVDIVWDSLDFIYNFGEGTWNPDDHTVTAGGSAGWDKPSAKIISPPSRMPRRLRRVPLGKAVVRRINTRLAHSPSMTAQPPTTGTSAACFFSPQGTSSRRAPRNLRKNGSAPAVTAQESNAESR